MPNITVDQLMDNDAPVGFNNAAVATNTLTDLLTPGSSEFLRIRYISISGDFANGDLIEILEESKAVGLEWRWEDEIIVITIPGSGWLFSTVNKKLQFRHQKGTNAIVTINVIGRSEA